MKNTHLDTKNFFSKACYFEGSLIIVSLVLGWLMQIDPFATFYFSEISLAYGFFATLPLLMLFFAMQHMAYASIQQIRLLLQQTLGPVLGDRHWADLLVLACIAGFSEELLFRGTLQPGIENLWNMQAGLIVSNLIFALVHAITPLYMLLAFLIGLYLGVSLDYGGERNLLTPVVIHSLYDFIAFMVILRKYKNAQSD